MYRILTEPKTNLIRQQIELMKSENVNLTFTDGSIREIARVAFIVSNITFVDNIIICICTKILCI